MLAGRVPSSNLVKQNCACWSYTVTANLYTYRSISAQLWCPVSCSPYQSSNRVSWMKRQWTRVELPANKIKASFAQLVIRMSPRRHDLSTVTGNPISVTENTVAIINDVTVTRYSRVNCTFPSWKRTSERLPCRNSSRFNANGGIYGPISQEQLQTTIAIE